LCVGVVPICRLDAFLLGVSAEVAAGRACVHRFGFWQHLRFNITYGMVWYGMVWWYGTIPQQCRCCLSAVREKTIWRSSDEEERTREERGGVLVLAACCVRL
jgi:hypothetical protein